MALKNQKCPKCGKDMESGFVADKGDGISFLPSSWVEGTPEKAFWTITKIKGKRVYAVSTFRCTGCGFLESYANSQIGVKQ